MGDDNLILGYPWFAVTNAHPNWKIGTLPTLVIIHTRGVASGKPTHSVQVVGMRTMIWNRPFLQKGDELFLRIMKVNPTCTAKTIVVQQLAEQAADKTTCTWDQIVPPQYHVHAKVFSEDAAQQFPESHEWDHTIDLKPNAPTTLDCNIYPLSPNEDTVL